jgi:DNA-binding transcriptional ArsR family regulator
VVLRLAGGPKTVSEVRDCCGIHLSGVSRHLTQLRRAGIVEASREGREVRYRLRGAELAAWFEDLAAALQETAACCPTDHASPPRRPGV